MDVRRNLWFSTVDRSSDIPVFELPNADTETDRHPKAFDSFSMTTQGNASIVSYPRIRLNLETTAAVPIVRWSGAPIRSAITADSRSARTDADGVRAHGRTLGTGDQSGDSRQGCAEVQARPYLGGCSRTPWRGPSAVPGSARPGQFAAIHSATGAASQEAGAAPARPLPLRISSTAASLSPSPSSISIPGVTGFEHSARGARPLRTSGAGPDKRSASAVSGLIASGSAVSPVSNHLHVVLKASTIGKGITSSTKAGIIFRLYGDSYEVFPNRPIRNRLSSTEATRRS